MLYLYVVHGTAEEQDLVASTIKFYHSEELQYQLVLARPSFRGKAGVLGCVIDYSISNIQ